MKWITIFFFIGLFVVVHGVDVAGILNLLANKLVAATGGNMAHTGYAILWSSAVLSAIIDNIPFVATMIPLIVRTWRPLSAARITYSRYGGACHSGRAWAAMVP